MGCLDSNGIILQVSKQNILAELRDRTGGHYEWSSKSIDNSGGTGDIVPADEVGEDILS
jgi:hypothetical protein